MKTKNKILPVTLSITLVGNLALAGSPVTAYAAEEASKKEEVVYAMLESSGDVNGIYVVNSFSGGDIVDYGTYTNIKNLTTTDTITTEGNRITVHTDAKKLYYQGDLATKEIPWNIAIQYYIDGKEYSAEEIAGMSGKLEISIDITQNQNCNASFWNGYALQATLTLDTKKCSNIVAENATIANVGANKQLSYIIMPGKGANLTITADVTDFEMDAISINGTKLNLSLDYDDSELTDRVNELKDAISDLDDGADKLSDGADSLNDGISAMQEALNTLNGESDTLTDGSAQIKEALTEIQDALSNVSMDADSLTELSKASTQIKTGIDSLVTGLETVDNSIDTYYNSLSAAGLSDINDYVNKHNQAIAALNISNTQRTLYQEYVSAGDAGVLKKLGELVQGGDKEALSLYEQYQKSGGDATVIQSYLTTAGKLITIETLLTADISYIQGSNTLIGGIDGALDKEQGELMTGATTLQDSYATFDSTIQALTTSLQSLSKNMTTLKSGIDKLVKNYKKFDSGLNKYTDAVAEIVTAYDAIYDGSLDLANGASELYDGTTEFHTETESIDTEISDTIDETIDELTGKDVETVSFVSEQNTNIDSVLFVIKTPAIEVAETETTVVVEEQPLSFWEKFLKLFGQ